MIYLQGSATRTLTFNPHADAPLRVYVDSDWAVKFSVSGAAIFYMGCLVHWFAKTQRSVSLSSTEAEFFAAMMAAREVVHLRDVLSDLGLMVVGPTLMRSDNKSVIDLSLDAIAFKKTKHIMRAAEFLRDLCLRGVFELRHIPGAENVADLFTKAVGRQVFMHLMRLLSGADGRVL
jgi:hypothetical protein